MNGGMRYCPRTPKRDDLWSRRPVVLARERSDEAIQTVAPAALVWIASQGEREAFVRLRSQGRCRPRDVRIDGALLMRA